MEAHIRSERRRPRGMSPKSDMALLQRMPQTAEHTTMAACTSLASNGNTHAYQPQKPPNFCKAYGKGGRGLFGCAGVKRHLPGFRLNAERTRSLLDYVDFMVPLQPLCP